MPTKLCNKCGKIIQYPLTYCEQCKPTQTDKAQDDKYYNRYRRDKRSAEFYNSQQWRKLSQHILMSNNYQCAECGKIATEVHHIKELKDNWDKRLDIDNLMPLCTGCHNRTRK